MRRLGPRPERLAARRLCVSRRRHLGAWALRRVEFFPALLLGFAALVCCWMARRKARAPGAPARCAAGLCLWPISDRLALDRLCLLVDPSAHLWQLPFAILLLTGGLALYAGIACALAMLVVAGWAVAAFDLFALSMRRANGCAAMRSPAFPGICRPMAGARRWAVLQSASLIGAYGLSFLTILLGASLAEFFTRRIASRRWR